MFFKIENRFIKIITFMSIKILNTNIELEKKQQ